MTNREVKNHDADSLSVILAEKIAKALDSGEGLMLYILDPRWTRSSIQEIPAHVKHCRDLDAIESVVKRDVIEYPQPMLEELIASAIEDADSYGESQLEAAIESPEKWGSIPGFETLAHMHATIVEILADGTGRAELITLRADHGAANPFIVARTPDWSIGIESSSLHDLPVAMIGTQQSLRALLN